MSDTKKKEIIYSADQALKNPAQDKFNRASFAERISDILISKQYTTPLVIGIYGKWGEGKTSVVNFIKFYLRKNDEDNEIVYLNFNPWRFNDEVKLLNSFFKQFSQGISQKLKKDGKKIAKELLTYFGLMVSFAEPITGLSTLSPVGNFDKIIESVKSFFQGENYDIVIDSLQSSLEKTDTIEEQKENINRELIKTGKKHVIFIDDIDRLSKKEIQILFKLIKLTADFENVIYVLSFDPKIVASALSETYPGNNKESGFKFLEKIVQVPLELPKIRRTDLLNDVLFPGIENILNNKAIKLTEDEERDIANALMNNFNSRLSTPRMAKKYINALNFSIPLLKGEVNTFDLVLIEGLRICYPDVYEFIYSNKNLFIQDTGKSLYPKQEDIDEEQKKSRQEFLKDKPSEANKIVRSLFPKADSNFSLLSSGNDASKHKSISSPHYFDRYFSYSVAQYDIRDSDFEKLIHNFSNSNEALQLAEEMIDQAGSDTFLRRIEDYPHFVKTVDIEFAICLATLGKHFTKYHGVRNFASPIYRVSNIIRDLILNENDSNKRFEIIKKAINNCTNILLVVEILYHFKKENNPNNKVLNDKDYQELKKLIAGKIKEDAKKNGMFYKRNDLEKESPKLLIQWKIGASKKEVSDYILNQIGNSPKQAIQFLKSFMTTRYEGDETIKYFQFKAEHYKNIRELVDVDAICKILYQDFENEMKDSHYINIQDYENGFNKGLAKKFAYLHKNFEANN